MSLGGSPPPMSRLLRREDDRCYSPHHHPYHEGYFKADLQHTLPAPRSDVTDLEPRQKPKLSAQSSKQ